MPEDDDDDDDDLAFRLVFGFFWALPEPFGASMKLSTLTSTKRRQMTWNASRWEIDRGGDGPRSMAVGGPDEARHPLVNVWGVSVGRIRYNM